MKGTRNRSWKSATIMLLFLLTGANHIYAKQWMNPADKYLNAYKEYRNAKCPIENDGINNFVYFAGDRAAIRGNPFLRVDRFKGAQIMYSWRELEPTQGDYDFSAIREDLAYLAAHGKQLWVQLQDATFSGTNIAVPDYLLTPRYDGGAVQERTDQGKLKGWAAKRWNPKVRHQFAQLIAALGREFDGKIAGINLQETAVDVSKKDDPTFTPERYVEGIKANMLALKRAFPHSVTMQYANFIPGEFLPWTDKGYLRSVYAYGNSIGVGLGAPDLMVERRGQLNNPLAMMHEGHFSVPLGIAVQDGNYIGKTGTTKVITNAPNIVPVLHAFAHGFLRVSYLFWSNQEPYFTKDVLPCFEKR
ncbi:hypothetical protein MSP8886_01349 [Marinomonas spartinae]|uniref:Glycoside hydrolase family 42 N-terminal domain-containing protein n=1 Tax=Marinomonas spartinae TaxID=1792290 RepID=A0A1A8T8Z9_9GAMM|nr:hypothetical protein [Marinomonas spartinae]SBS28890.1 hypothetical protein MSP8886_01349 [Marinomonas spartinae]